LHRLHRLIAFVPLVVAGCSGGSTGSGSPVAPNRGLRIVGVATAGAQGDALAAALLLSSGVPVDRADRARIKMADEALRKQLIAMSVTHLRTASTTAGAGTGQMGSATIRRLAALPDAAADQNGNGTNLDEVLREQQEFLAQTVGGALPAVFLPVLFPWRDGSGEFARRVDPDSPSEPTRPGRTGQVDVAQVGYAMLARVMLAGALLREDRDAGIDALGDRRMLAMLLLQQVLAMEETLFTSLFMDDAALGALRFPTDYDPAQGKRWLPRAIGIGEDAKIPGLVTSYGIQDRSSGLEALASMMRAGGELAFLASDATRDPGLYDVFHGLPFGPLPDVLGQGGSDGGGRILTWEDGPSKILRTNCAGCHDSRFKPEPGLFAADSYDNVHLGGRNSRPGTKTPIITRGDPSKSPLYYILLKDPPFPFTHMPAGGQLGEKDIAVIKQWIEDGARSSPPGPPEAGADLAVTMYKNFVAMHVGPNGELFEQHDGDAVVPFANPATTGAALQALASLAHLAGSLPDWKKVFTLAAEFAALELTRPSGEVVRSFDIAKGVGSGAADLFGHARMVVGLSTAGRVLGSASLRTRAEAVAKRMLENFFDRDQATFRTEVGVPGARFTPVVVAAVVDALREMADARVADAVMTHDGFLKSMLPVIAFSELSGTGEILGDGIADTDKNGIREPALAGGEFGRAPLFVGEIRDGGNDVPSDSKITWSRHIQPLLRQNCGICHMDGTSRGNGYFLDTPALLRKTINPKNPMALLVPGDPEDSFLYRKLVDRRPSIGEQMPLQVPPLAAHGKALVRKWILEGATSR
jgi:hypothetical protein